MKHDEASVANRELQFGGLHQWHFYYFVEELVSFYGLVLFTSTEDWSVEWVEDLELGYECLEKLTHVIISILRLELFILLVFLVVAWH